MIPVDGQTAGVGARKVDDVEVGDHSRARVERTRVKPLPSPDLTQT